MTELNHFYQRLIQRLQTILTEEGWSGNITLNDVGDYFFLTVGYSIPKKKKSSSNLTQPQHKIESGSHS